MKRVVLFGADVSGSMILSSLRIDWSVLAFTDNDALKWGNELAGIKIINPKHINNLKYDYVVIANRYGDVVKKQLIEELGVAKEKIVDAYNNNLFDNRIALLRLAAQEIYENNIAGSVAELGVYQGDFAQYINAVFADKKLYLFDTFDGFPEKDVSLDLKNQLSNSRVGQFKETSVDLALAKMPKVDNCIVKKGYFPETAKGLTETFCFVSLDSDLYESIYNGLRFFYDKMSEGGYIFIHDYNSINYRGTKEAVRQFMKERKIKYVPVNDSGGTVVIVK